jgi:uncharacterized protein
MSALLTETISVLVSAPVIVKILLSLAVILVVNKLTNNLLIALIAGALTIGFWSGHTVTAVASIAWGRFFSIDNAMLLLVVVLIIWLSSQMSKTGVMDDLVSSVRSKLSGRAAIGVLPAVIGLLPMPGGALFSAPLVENVDDGNRVEPIRKTRINYYFRHVWEFWWPLYPGVLLAIDLSGLEMWQFIVLNCSVSLVMITCGYVFFLRKLPDGEKRGEKAKDRFLRLVLPIVIVIVTATLLRLVFPGLADISRFLPMGFGVAAAIVYLQLQRPLPLRELFSIPLTGKTFTMIGIVSFIRIFGAFIETKLPSGTFLMEQMKNELAILNIPVIALIIVIPFISGITTGMAIGFVGASFPIVISLIGTDPSAGLLFSTVVIAYGFGFMGMILSPVHVCLVVTNAHFKTKVGWSLAGLVPPMVFVVLYCLVLSVIVQLAFGNGIWGFV